MGKISWALYKTIDLTDVLITAKNMGWKEDKVQVRRHFDGRKETYTIEPYEEYCQCPQILRYQDYFTPEDF